MMVMVALVWCNGGGAGGRLGAARDQGRNLGIVEVVDDQLISGLEAARHAATHGAKTDKAQCRCHGTCAFAAQKRQGAAPRAPPGGASLAQVRVFVGLRGAFDAEAPRRLGARARRGAHAKINESRFDFGRRRHLDGDQSAGPGAGHVLGAVIEK